MKRLLPTLAMLLFALPVPAAENAAPEPLSGEVARAQFTSNVQDREPVDEVNRVTATTDKVYFFTELRGFGGQTVTHRWRHKGEVIAEVPFDVGGPRWRVWSSKNLMPDWAGTWTVEVVDGLGNVVRTATLEVESAAADAAADTGAASDATETETPGAMTQEAGSAEGDSTAETDAGSDTGMRESAQDDK